MMEVFSTFVPLFWYKEFPYSQIRKSVEAPEATIRRCALSWRKNSVGVGKTPPQEVSLGEIPLAQGE